MSANNIVSTTNSGVKIDSDYFYHRNMLILWVGVLVALVFYVAKYVPPAKPTDKVSYKTLAYIAMFLSVVFSFHHLNRMNKWVEYSTTTVQLQPIADRPFPLYPSLVLFYHKGCPWCDDVLKAGGEWEKTVKALNEAGFPNVYAIETTDAAKMKMFKDADKIEGVPHLRWYYDIGNYAVYNKDGERTAQAFITWIQARIDEHVSPSAPIQSAQTPKIKETYAPVHYDRYFKK